MSLANRYFTGNGVPRDPEKAVRLCLAPELELVEILGRDPAFTQAFEKVIAKRGRQPGPLDYSPKVMCAGCGFVSCDADSTTTARGRICPEGFMAATIEAPMRARSSDAAPDANRTRRRLRLGLAIASGPLAALLLLACYLWMGDRTLLGEIVTIWPPVGWGFLLLVRAAVLRIRRQNRVALATLVGTVALLVGTTEWKPLMRAWGGAASHPASASAETLPLRLVVWNVSGSSPLAELKALSPDICLFQEIGCLSAAVRRSSAWGGYYVLEGFDPGILSRHPMRRLPTERVGPWTEPLIALVELPGDRRVVVVNVRLTLPGIALSMASPSEWHRLPANHSERLAQFPRLAALIERTLREQHAAFAIVAGDFNTPGGMASLAPLRSIVHDAWPVVGVGWGGTMTAEMPLSRIDQCWISEGIVPVAAHVERRGASDHRLLIVDLLVQDSRSGS